jgi:hypothetical protein
MDADIQRLYDTAVDIFRASFEFFLLRRKIIFCNAMPGLGEQRKANKEAFLRPEGQIMSIVDLAEGSEKPTLQRGKEDRSKEETGSVDFYSRKVFLIPSRKVFWGNSTAISTEGRDIMASMALFLKQMPGRVVISENASGEIGKRRFGLQRALAVMNCLTREQGLDGNWFSISAASTITDERAAVKSDRPIEAERTLEIVLLERSIYN